MRVLHVVANPKPEGESASKEVAAAFFEGLKKARPDAQVTTADLYEDPPPYYSYPMYRNFWYPVFQPGYEPGAEEREAAEYAGRQARAFNEADVLALTAPMWNFSLPAILKAWIDQVLSPGLTFTMGAQGVTPLHKIKRIVVLAASGGVYEAGDERDTFIAQLRAAFGFVGIEQVDAAWADGQNVFFFTDSQERKEKAAARARKLGESIGRM